jgi:lipid II:glycine glycyltransferase (peptidoglycan interpeptide bridge formation enzyme)
MAVRRVEKKDKEAFNGAAGHPLQTWEWGEFRKETGNEIVRLGVFSESKLKVSSQLTLHKLPGIKSLKIGALIKGPKPNKELLQALKDLAKEENIIFIKMEPNMKENNTYINNLRGEGAVPGKTLFTPTTFWIDLTKDEDKMMENFHSKTRYNIRYARKKGVEVQEDNSDPAFERYIELTRKTVERQGFYAHTERYHRLMWQHLNKDMIKRGETPIARLLTATYKGEILTTWIVFVWHDFLYYPYGASTLKHRNVQANNLMMWEAIRYGKKLGLKIFDLWGREEGKGFTQFKEGYNPKVIKFIGTWDLVTSPLYYPYRAAEAVRWTLLRMRTKIGITKPKF